MKLVLTKIKTNHYIFLVIKPYIRFPIAVWLPEFFFNYINLP